MIENPILKGFNPDPSIIRVDNVYYIATSTFEWFPGIPIYKSYDLKHWKLISHAITRNTQADLKGIGSSLGVWAPSLSYDFKESKFYLCFSLVYGANQNNFDVDNFLLTTTDIEGDWSDSIYLNSSGFDPSIFHDDDGRKWIVNLEWDFRQGYEHPGAIVIEEYDKISQTVIGGSKTISRGATNRGCLEGPSIYKKNGYYYLITAEGGTGYGHCVAISRAKDILGPYEKYYNNPIITSQPVDFNERGIESSAKPHKFNPESYLQKSGHGNIVETPDNEVYMTHLCSRPLRPTLRSVLGRESAIQKCKWTDDGWICLYREDNIAKRYVEQPNIDEHKFKITNCTDHFDSNSLDIGFYTPRENISNRWLSLSKNSTLSIRGRQSLFSKYDQSLIAKRVKNFKFTASTYMIFEPENFLEMAGLVNYYNNENFYFLRLYYSQSLNSAVLCIVSADKGTKHEYTENKVLIKNPLAGIYLRCDVDNEKLQYYYALQKDKWIKIGGILDASILSDEYAGGFTGSFVGITVQDMYKRKKWADFDYFSYSPID